MLFKVLLLRLDLVLHAPLQYIFLCSIVLKAVPQTGQVLNKLPATFLCFLLPLLACQFLSIIIDMLGHHLQVLKYIVFD